MMAGASKSKPVVDHSIFALIIGIDNYANIRKLKGAVADARDAGSYLESLGVPGDRIRYLIDANATRVAVIQALKALKDDAGETDCIFIFYAGHGGEKDAPPGWASRASKVQMILPVDYRPGPGNGSVQGIPDRTISQLLDNLSEKVNNIVVIFDCCHSGGANRAQNCTARSVQVLDDIPEDLDRSIWASPTRTRGIDYETGFLHKGCRSHVFLAACSTDEHAYEDLKTINGQAVMRGEFTYALFSLLRSKRADQLTYAELLTQFTLPTQNPQCVGLHRDRILFHTKKSTGSRDLRKLFKTGNKYIMDAGAAYGITENAQFTLYQDEQSARQNILLGTLFVTKVNADDSELCIPSHADVDAFDSELHIPWHKEVVALQTKAGTRPDLLLHIPQDISDLDPVLTAIKCTADESQKISLVEKGDATLGIALDGRRLVFNILDKRVTQYSSTPISHRTEIRVDDISHITAILSAAAHYYWHLDRTVDNPHLEKKIEVEFTALAENPNIFDEDLQVLRYPVAPNLLQDHVIHVNADTKDLYGMKIINKSPLPLYVSIFYFDSNLSITSYYQPGDAGKSKLDPCLEKNGGFLAIGYGAGQSAAFEYTLKDRPIDQKTDVGFIKIFFSTEPVDLTHVPQASPFTPDRGTAVVKRGTAKMWLDICIRIIQHRCD